MSVAKLEIAGKFILYKNTTNIQCSPMQNIRRFNFPILILSAENDLPYMTDTLARFQANSNNDIRLKITKGQSHQTLLFKLGRQTFDDTQTITQFSREILKN